MRDMLYRLGGTLLVVGAILPLLLPQVAPFVFAVGAILFCPLQITDRYEGRNLVVRRLRRQQVLAALLLIVTAVFMLTSHFGVPPFRGSEWKLTLTIAAVIELYTVFRISGEEGKNKQ